MLLLLRQLLLTIAIICAIHLAIITSLYNDLSSEIVHKKFRLWGAIRHKFLSIIVACGGLALSRWLSNPDVLRRMLPIKSKIAKKIIMKTIAPPIVQSIWSISLIALQLSLIDKLLYTLCRRRFPYILSLIATICISTITASTLYVVLKEETHVIAQKVPFIEQINQTTSWVLTALIGALLLANILRSALLIFRPQNID